MEIVAATAADYTEVMRLLASAALPTSDLTTASLQHFLVLREQGQITGTIGFDLAGDVALLRSLAVGSSTRGRGYGKALVVAAESLAAKNGVKRLFLLTTTADQFFAVHSYTRASREQAPHAIQQMPQFAGLCPSTSTLMFKSL